MNALWLALDFPHFTLDRVTRGHARAERLLLAVSDGHPQRPALTDCTAAAQRLGVRAGLPLNAALALADTLQVVSPDPGEETQALERLAAWGYQYSSQVALGPPGGPPALLLEVRASERLFGPAGALATRLTEALGGLGYHVRAGLAPTPDAALLAAPDAQHLPDRESLARALARLPLARLRLDAPARATLAESGVRTVGEVLRLPRKALARRVGTAACAYLDRVLGHRAHTLRPYRPPHRYAATLDLPAELTRAPALLFPLQRMLGELCGALRGLDRALQELVITLHGDGQEQALRLVVQRPTRDPSALLRLARERLERLRLVGPVRRIGLEAGTLLAHAPAQAGLLPEPGARAADVDGLIDRLRARLGASAVRGLRGRPDHRPEHSWAFEAPAGDAPCEALPARPTWLFPEPRPCDIARYHVLSGPERIETGWWDGGDCRRDYFVVRDPDGALLWAYREYKPRPGWYLHGLFG